MRGTRRRGRSGPTKGRPGHDLSQAARDRPRCRTPEEDTSMRDDVRDESCPPMRELLDAVSLVVTCRAQGADVVLDPESDGGVCVRGAHLVERLMPDIRSLGPAL